MKKKKETKEKPQRRKILRAKAKPPLRWVTGVRRIQA
jgi:hypothetical protein